MVDIVRVVEQIPEKCDICDDKRVKYLIYTRSLLGATRIMFVCDHCRARTSSRHEGIF